MSTTVLKRERQRRGLSQPQMARLFNTSQPTILNWEKGRTRPQSGLARDQLEAFFGIPFEVLVGPPQNEKEASPEGPASKANRALSNAGKGPCHGHDS